MTAGKERRPHLPLLAAVGLGTLVGAVVCAIGDSALLCLSAPVGTELLCGCLLGAGVMVAAAAVALLLSLGPVPAQLGPLALRPDSPLARAAKNALLAGPLRVTTAGMGAGLLAAVVGALVLTEHGQPPARVLAVLGLAMTQVGLWGLLVYGLVRRALAPLLYPLRAAAPPQGRGRAGAELEGWVSYSFLAAVGAAVLPAIVLATLPAAPRSPTGEGQLGLAVTVAGLGGLALIIALGIGRRLRSDVATLSQTTQRLLAARLDQQVRLLVAAPPAATAEVEELQRAVFDLIDRARRLQVEIFLATERTIEARRAKSQHLAATSHDLRNALSPVLGFTDLLAGGYEGELPHAGQLRIRRMQHKGRRQLRILSEILDTAKIESRTIELHPRDCAPAELLAQTVAEVRRLRSVEVLPIRIELDPDLPPLAVDPLRFPQALSYLCGHILDSLAAEAEAGGAFDGELPPCGELLLRAGQLADGAAVVFEVAYLSADRPAAGGTNGGGADASGTALGTSGLGLALPLARQLCALHGGSVAVVAGGFPRLRATFPLLPRSR